MSTVNEQLAHASIHHRIECVEDVANTWSVVCRGGCIETDPRHPNYGHPWCAPAPQGEYQALRIALDHLAKLGYVPQRAPKVIPVPGYPMGVVAKPRNSLD